MSARLTSHAIAEISIAGYTFDSAPDLGSTAERARLSASALRGFFNITAKWGLTEAQKRDLLGGMSTSTFHAWRTKPGTQRLSQDVLTRISLVLGIYKALHIHFGAAWADRWVTLGNRGAMFMGQAPIAYMTHQGQPGMLDVRRMLDAACGGR